MRALEQGGEGRENDRTTGISVTLQGWEMGKGRRGRRSAHHQYYTTSTTQGLHHQYCTTSTTPPVLHPQYYIRTAPPVLHQQCTAMYWKADGLTWRGNGGMQL